MVWKNPEITVFTQTKGDGGQFRRRKNRIQKTHEISRAFDQKTAAVRRAEIKKKLLSSEH